MTARELAELRDEVARKQLGIVSPQRGDGSGERPVVEGPVHGPPTVSWQAPRIKYPVLGRTSILECPVHQLIVALNEAGRICSSCPGCRREAEAALGMVA